MGTFGLVTGGVPGAVIMGLTGLRYWTGRKDTQRSTYRVQLGTGALLVV